MVNLSIEAVAILCYTAIALFLSLYFVPFKVVPRAWAKAVRTKGHPAQIALTAVLTEAAPLVAKEVKVPTVAEIVAAVKIPAAPDLSKLAIRVDFANLSQDDEGALIRLMQKAMNRKHLEGARDSRADPQEQDLAIAQHATSNPGSADLFAKAQRGIELLVNQKLIKPATGKDWLKQIRAQYAETGDITDLVKSFGFGNILQGGGGGGGSGSSASHY